MSKKRNARRRTRNVLLIVSMMLVVAMASVGATVAWLTDDTDTIINTFTSAGVEIDLTETKQPDGSTETTPTKWEAKMVPGVTYAKNPYVEVKSATDVPVYLFVKFEENTAAKSYLTYTSNLTSGNGWTELTEGSGIWYRVVNPTDTTKGWYLLAGNNTYTDGCVTVSSSVTENNMSTASAAELKYTAYAIQVAGFENNAAGAWDEINK